MNKKSQKITLIMFVTIATAFMHIFLACDSSVTANNSNNESQNKNTTLIIGKWEKNNGTEKEVYTFSKDGKFTNTWNGIVEAIGTYVYLTEEDTLTLKYTEKLNYDTNKLEKENSTETKTLIINDKEMAMYGEDFVLSGGDTKTLVGKWIGKDFRYDLTYDNSIEPPLLIETEKLTSLLTMNLNNDGSFRMELESSREVKDGDGMAIAFPPPPQFVYEGTWEYESGKLKINDDEGTSENLVHNIGDGIVMSNIKNRPTIKDLKKASVYAKVNTQN